MNPPQPTPSQSPAVDTDRVDSPGEIRERLLLLHRLACSRALTLQPGLPGRVEAVLGPGQVRALFESQDLADRFPPIMTYEQTAELLQVSVSTLKGWFSQGRFANCVKRGKPARVLRDALVREFLRDEFGINGE